jgi:heme-degrading monooxygenase HmoA
MIDSRVMSSTDLLARTPSPPYYAVIFTSQRMGPDRGYAHVADRMIELARQQPGFLGVDSVRAADGFGITVSYWTSKESIDDWEKHTEHQTAQCTGQAIWYADYQVRVALVERDYGK